MPKEIFEYKPAPRPQGTPNLKELVDTTFNVTSVTFGENTDKKTNETYRTCMVLVDGKEYFTSSGIVIDQILSDDFDRALKSGKLIRVRLEKRGKAYAFV